MNAYLVYSCVKKLIKILLFVWFSLKHYRTSLNLNLINCSYWILFKIKFLYDKFKCKYSVKLKRNHVLQVSDSHFFTKIPKKNIFWNSFQETVK